MMITHSKYLLVILLGLLAGSNLFGFQYDLLFSEADVPRIRANTENPVFAEYWKALLEEDIEEDGNFLREAFIYVVTGEAERGERAHKYLMERVRESSWNLFQDADGTPIGFLRTSAKTHQTALAFDWLYHLCTEAERKEILKAIAEKGCQPMFNALYGMKYPETVKGWGFTPDGPYAGRKTDMSRWPDILSRNNFRAVINGGLAMGTVVLLDEDERAEKWKAILLESVPQFNALFKDDGSYDEAVAYVNYAMKYQVDAMEVVRRKFDIDFYDTANFTGMIDYVLAMYLPNHYERHGSVSFGDSGASLQSFAAFWIAGKSRDGLSQDGGLNYADHYWTSLLYYDETVQPRPPREGNRLDELDLDWIIARTGYGVDDLVVGMRSGEPMNHEHGDRNSILLKAYGEILLADQGRVTYLDDSPEWVMRTSKGHNMILIDGEGVQYHKGEEGTNESKSHAEIVRSGERHGYVFWASDASQGYRVQNPDVGSVTRSVVVFPEAPLVVVLDKVIMRDDLSTISARWFPEGRDDKSHMIIGENKDFTIKRPQARLHTHFSGTVSLEAQKGSYEFPDSGKSYSFIDVTGTRKVKEALLITIATPLKNEEPDPVVNVEQNKDEWILHYTKNGSSVVMHIIDEGRLPEFEILENAFSY